MPREREFDLDNALRDLTQVFWTRGFEGASLQDIETATGLKKQSLYRAFGDKRGMYLAALDAYEKNEIAAGAKQLLAPGTPYERFDRTLSHVIESALKSGDRRGCFLCNASVDQAPLDAETSTKIDQMMARIEATFEDALKSGARYAADADLRRMTARTLMASYFGIRVLIKAGLSGEALLDAKIGTLAALADA